jgi:hypothetical protein
VSDLEEKRNVNLQRNTAKLRELGLLPEPEPMLDPALTMYVKMNIKISTGLNFI